MTSTSTSLVLSSSYAVLPTSPSSISDPVTPTTASTADFQSTPATSPQSSIRSPITFDSTTKATETPSPSPSSFRSGLSAFQIARSEGNELNGVIEGSLPRAVAGHVTCPSPRALTSIHPYQPPDPFSELKLQRPIANGQWSTVYAATCDASQTVTVTQRRPSRCMATPGKPLRPDPNHGKADQGKSTGQLFAAKIGIGKSAGEVLRNEARILTFLMHRPLFKEFVVQFCGYDMQHKALVMECIPITLENFVMELNAEQNLERSERVKKELLPISRRLVDGLDFLHCENIIHGDIKPANILLRVRRIYRNSGVAGLEDSMAPVQGQRHDRDNEDARLRDRFQLQPVYCDFSASRLNHPASIPSESAGTYDFMAPELFSLSKPDSYPSFASDVYALGVTFIYAIIGRSPYDGASNVFMRRAMAMQGSPLDFLAADMKSFSRIEEARFQPWVEMAVQTKPHNRWTAATWRKSMNNDCDV